MRTDWSLDGGVAPHIKCRSDLPQRSIGDGFDPSRGQGANVIVVAQKRRSVSGRDARPALHFVVLAIALVSTGCTAISDSGPSRRDVEARASAAIGPSENRSLLDYIAPHGLAANRPAAARSLLEPRDPRACAAVEPAVGAHPAGRRARGRDPRRVRRIERDDMALIAMAEPDLRAREDPLHRAAGAGVDRADDVKDLHLIVLCATRRLGRDNRFAIARAGINHKL